MTLLWTSISALLAVSLQTAFGQYAYGGMMQQAAQAQAYCSFDLRCYGFRPGCALNKKVDPFYCMPGVSCEDCLNLCQQSIATRNPRTCCRSVGYNTFTKTCSLYNVAASSKKDFKSVYGQNYFQPTYMPNCMIQSSTPASSSTEAPAAAVCKEGETGKLIAVQDYAVGSISGKDVPGVDADACGKACLSGKLPDGSSFACKSAQFKDSKCTLSEDAPKSESEQTKSPGSTFYRLYCFPSELVKGCPDVFTEAPQKILVGQNKQTVDKASLDECIKACLTAEKDAGFACQSGMFYYNDQKLNCILNVESAKTKPDLFTDAGPDDIEVYFELGCGGGKKYNVAAKRKSKQFKDALKDLPDNPPWTYWSNCSGRKSNQVRFQPCGEKDSRKCPRQERSCDPAKPLKESGGKSSGKKKKTNGEHVLVENMRKKDQAISRN